MNKKKICIVSTSQVNNYGAVLQNYALQEILSPYFDTFTLNYRSEGLRKTNQIIFSKPFKFIKKIGYKFLYPNYFSVCKKREKLFNNFRINYLNYTEPYKISELKKLNNQFDYFLSGSDQTFNLNIYCGETASLLDFVSDNKKKISYAASFGGFVSDLYKNVIINNIKTFSSLLIRETSGVDFIKINTDKTAHLVVDPIFLLTKNQWKQKLNIGAKKSKKKYILIYMLKEDSNIFEAAKSLAKKENLDIINVFGGNTGIKLKGITRNVVCGPNLWLELIMNAEYVFAVSFHAVAFSILFNKKFYYTLDHKIDSSSDRVIELLKKFHLPSREVCGGVLPNNTIDWNETNRLIEYWRNLSIELLFDSVYITNPQKKIEQNVQSLVQSKQNISIVGSECVGCGNCELSCPTNAISMIEDDEGFLYPNIKYDLCTRCGLCVQSCPKIQKVSSKANVVECYGLHLKDKEKLNASTSGGVAQSLYRLFLKNGGIGYGVAYKSNFSDVEYIRITEIEEIKKVLKSKYVQASPANVLFELKRDLEENKEVLFVGTPCSILSVELFLGRKYENLYFVEVICHGPTSKKVLQRYYNDLKIDNKTIQYFSMREKNKKSLSNIKIITPKRIIEERFSKSNFGLMFNCVTRPSCLACSSKFPYTKADMIIGDYWGCDKDKIYYSTSGTSALVVLTTKGARLFDKIKDNFIYGQTTFEDIVKFNRSLIEPISPFYGRKAFIRDILNGKNILKSFNQNQSRIVKIKRNIPSWLKRILKRKK